MSPSQDQVAFRIPGPYQKEAQPLLLPYQARDKELEGPPPKNVLLPLILYMEVQGLEDFMHTCIMCSSIQLWDFSVDYLLAGTAVLMAIAVKMFECAVALYEWRDLWVGSKLTPMEWC